ncbi:MAG: hypothetical protein UY92_C0002G0052 [Candidatus Magasanikbacteria bacterium GW2011_GWA2_56_11]|uniref:Uncharacterized protein n=1 Tax=Candidatus Magasanikbacteria bacterium GW2011_GWA2_56_11 TaxID=1619044 RepID=A0A0G1YI82_9BACT|nr:MAG: hypothetical protein UY92_C0002G0052 [Candidatus Magasanikbacteria bacterium GW2011_GWA2_56_11]
MNIHQPPDRASQTAEPVKLVKRCPVCAREHSLERVKIIYSEPQASVLHITCPHCAHAMVAVVGATRHGVGLFGAVTDLTGDDVERLQTRLPMSGDELIDAAAVIRRGSSAVVSALMRSGRAGAA